MSVQVGDVGVSLEFTVLDAVGEPVDLTTAPPWLLEMHLRDPAGLRLVRAAERIGANVLRYVTDANDFTMAGTWEVRGRFSLGAWRGHTSPFMLPVVRGCADTGEAIAEASSNSQDFPIVVRSEVRIGGAYEPD